MKIDLADTAVAYGNDDFAIKIYERILEDYPDLFMHLPRLKSPLTPAFIAFEIVRLRTTGFTNLSMDNEVKVLEQYIAEYPSSPYTDDALWQIANEYSNVFHWDIAFKPNEAINALKRILNQPEIKADLGLMYEWRNFSIRPDDDFDKFKVLKNIGEATEYSLKDCAAAIPWYDKAIEAASELEKSEGVSIWRKFDIGNEKTDLASKLLYLKQTCKK